MVKTTKAQRAALKQIVEQDLADRAKREFKQRYRELRRSVMPTIGCDGAVVVKKWGMFIAIETDGYRHT